MPETKKVKFEGKGKFNREDHVTFYNSNITSIDENGIVYGDSPVWMPFGEDNEEITREMNNDVEAKKNVLGENTIDHSKGAQTTQIDPIAIKRDDVLSYILYNIFKYELVGDKATLQCMEVTYADVQNDKTYGAFTEDAIVDVTSWGGDTSKLNSPATLNWKGNRVHGTFSTETKAFTKTTSA
ncbi:MAG TPA: hypothetical protein DCE23_04430 [Firmicutes bacterium]|nr:hypothetical protein [Bacillota bacterium]